MPVGWLMVSFHRNKVVTVKTKAELLQKVQRRYGNSLEKTFLSC